MFAALDRLRALFALWAADALPWGDPRRLRAHPELHALEPRMMPDGRPLPLPVIYAGSGGGAPEVRAFDGEDGDLLFTRTVFESSFTGGVRVAVGDFTLDGYPDVVAAAGPGAGPRVRVLDGKTGDEVPGPVGSFWAFEPWFSGGVHVAAADVDGDGYPDVVAAAGVGGGPRVRIVSGADGRTIADFFAYDPDFRGGITVAAADLTGDGRAEIAVGAGPGGGPRVRVYDGATRAPLTGPLRSFFAFAPDFGGGVYIGADGLAGDADSDGTLDLVVGTGAGVAGRVKVYSGATGDVLRDFEPFGSGMTGGVRVALAYVDDDEFADVVAGTGPGGTATIRVFSGATGVQLPGATGEYAPFGGSTAGVYVAASNDPPVVSAGTNYNSGNEGNFFSLYFRFDLSTTSGSAVDIDYTVGGTATAGTDYTGLASGTTSVSPGNLTAFLPFTVVDDGVGEADETIVVTITSVTGGSVGSPSTETYTILNDDGPPPPPPPPPPPIALLITAIIDDTGYSAADALSYDTVLTVHGTGPVGEDVEVWSYGHGCIPRLLGTTTVDPDGTWDLVGVTMGEGRDWLQAVVVATKDVSPHFGLAIDTGAPAVTLSLPPDPDWPGFTPTLYLAATDTPQTAYAYGRYQYSGGFGPLVTFTLDIDLNNDGDYADAGEEGFADVPGRLSGRAEAVAEVPAYAVLPVGSAVRVRARVEDAAGNVGVGVSGDPAESVPADPGPDPGEGLAVSLAVPGADGFELFRTDVEAAAGGYPGAVRAGLPLDLDLSPAPAAGTPTGLTYVSAEVGLAPVVEVAARLSTASTATAAVGTLTWDGAVVGTTRYDVSELTGGAGWLFDLAPAAGQTTGLHTFTADLAITAGGSHPASVTGATFLVNRAASPFGAGWSLPGLDQLVAVAPVTGVFDGGMLLLAGGGGASPFETNGAGGFLTPRGDAGTLAAAGGGYVYTLASGERKEFSGAGRQTRWVSADGAAAVTLTYDGSGRLSTVAAPDGGVATFAYDGTSGLVATLTAPGGRVTTFTHTGTDLTGVVDPAGGVHTFAYDADHRLTDDHAGGVRTTYAYLAGAGYVATAGAEVRTVEPATGSALVVAANGPAWVTVTDGVGGVTRTAYEPTGAPVLTVDAAGRRWATDRDAGGWVTAETDPLDRTVTYTRDAAGAVTGVRYPDGTRTTFTYDLGNGHHSLLTATDELGRTTTYTYTAAGQVETVTDPASGVTTLTWSGGLLRTVTDPTGRVATATYDAARRPTDVLVGGASTGTLLYDAWGYAAGVTDPLGATTTVVNDAVGRPVTLTLPTGEVATATYDAVGLVTTRTAPSGLPTAYAYTAAGRLAGVTEGVGGGLERRTTAVYDAAGHRVAVVDPLGNRVTTGYDLVGRVVAVTDPLGYEARAWYDAAGRLTAAGDPLGRVTGYAYDARDRVVRVTDPLGSVTTLVYDAAGQRTAVVDPLGNRATAVYDALGRTVAVVDPLGNRATAVYDAASRPIAAVDPLGNRTTYGYDARGNLATVTDALGGVTTAAYDAADRPVAVTDPLAHTATVAYDAAGRVAAVVDPLGNRATTVYDAAGRAVATIDPLGNRTTAVYDALDRVEAAVDALGGRTTVGYDALDRVVSVTDPLGQTTTAVYDAASRPIARVDPLGNRTSFGYDPAGQLVSVTDPLGRETVLGYEERGLAARVVDPLGNVATTTYDAAGRPVAVTDPLGRTTTAVYDAASRLVATIDPLGNRGTVVYDAAGNAVAAVDPLGNRTTAVYDALNRAAVTIDSLGNRTTVGYDAASRPVSVTDPLGRTTTAVYDAASRLVATIDPLGNRGTVVYDAAGNAVATIDPLGNRTTAVYDALNRVIAGVDPLGNRTTIGYDAASRLVSLTDALGNTSTAVYDAASRFVESIDALGSASTVVYDAAGNAVATIDPLGHRATAVYDALDRVVATIDPLGNRSTAVYDAASQLTVTVDALGGRTTVGYDAAGRVTSVTDPLGNRATAVYDAAGNTVATVDPLGHRATAVYDPLNRVVASVDPLGNRTTAVYDAAGQVIATVDALTNRTTVGYDAAGRAEAVTDPLGRTTTAVYDAASRVVASVDALGNRTTAVYDAAGNPTATVDPLGNRTTVVYDALNRVLAGVDALGGRTTVGYDPAGRLVSVTDPLGHRTTTVYDAAGRIIATLDPLERAWATNYDAAGNPVVSVDPLGNRTTAVYDALNRPVATIDPRGNRTTAVYDAASRVVAAVDALGNRSTVVYDAAGRAVATVDPLGHRTTAVYDAAGNPTATIDALGGRATVVYDALNRGVAFVDQLGHRTTAVYDAAGQLVATVDPVGARATSVFDAAGRLVNTVDPLGSVATLGYDAASRLTTTTDPVGAVTSFGYDTLGRVRTVTDPLGAVSTTAYDAASRVTAVTDPLGNVTSFAYDATGAVTAVTDPRGHTFTSAYDAAGRLEAQIDPLGSRTTAVYDTASNVVAVVDPLGRRTTTAYDALNRAVAATLPDGGVWTTVYDAAGRPIAAVDPLGHRATTGYDALNRAVSATDARGFTTTVAYDTASRVTAVTDADGNVTSFARDAAGRVTAETDPLGAVATTVYDPRGNPTEAIDRSGRKREWGYDAAARVTTETWRTAAGALVQTQTFAYDAAGRQTVAADPDGTYTLAYDAAGRVTHVAEPFGLALTFGYDAAGNRTSVEDSRGGRTTVTFDAAGRQQAEELGGTGITKTRVTRGYDAAGQVVTVTREAWAAGTAGYALAGTTTFAYDAAGRTAGITHKTAAGTALATFAYEFDLAGRLTAQTDNGVGTSYAYDAADQLTTAGAATFGYDATGDRTNAGYATGAGNRTSTDGVWTLTYDADGRVSKRSKGASAETWVYAYDHRGQLTTATRSATDGGAATGVATYAYDAWGNLVSRDGWDGAATTSARYGVDGWDPAKPGAVGNKAFDVWVDLDGGGSVVARRSFAPAFDAPQVAVDGSGAASFYLADRLGSVRAVTTASGAVTGTAAYDAFGNLVSGARSDRYGWTGSAWDGLAGLQRNGGGARWYDPGSGRWLQPDPLGFAAGDPNLYRYVGNTPTGFTDPSGLEFTTDGPEEVIGSLEGTEAGGLGGWGGTDPGFYHTGIGAYQGDPGFYRTDGEYNGDPGFYRTDVRRSRTTVPNTWSGLLRIQSERMAHPGAELVASGVGTVVGGVIQSIFGINAPAPVRRFDLTGGVLPIDPPSDHLGVIVAQAMGYIVGKFSTQPRRLSHSGEELPINPPPLPRRASVTGPELPINPPEPPSRSLDEQIDEEWRNLPNNLINHFIYGRDRSLKNTFAFIDGLFKGFFIDGLGGTVESLGWLANFTPSAFLSAIFSQSQRDKYANMFASGRRLMDAGTRAIAEEVLRYHVARISGLGDEHLSTRAREVMRLTQYLMLRLGNEVLTNPNLRGRIYGFILYEVAEAYATAGVAKVGLPKKLSGILLRVAEKIEREGGSLALQVRRIRQVAEALDPPPTPRAPAAPHPAPLPAPVVPNPSAAPRTFPLQLLDDVQGALARLLGCYAAGTPLLTPDGARPIEAFQPGDRLLSRDENDPRGPVTSQEVEEVFVRSGYTAVVRVSGHDIETTAEHPVYVVGVGWREAGRLLPGDVLGSHNDVFGTVESVTLTGEYKAVYNLRVANWHTYFVGGDDWGFSVWAHNTCYEIRQLADGRFGLFERATGNLVTLEGRALTANSVDNVRLLATDAAKIAPTEIRFRTPRQVFEDARAAFEASGGTKARFARQHNLPSGTNVHHAIELQVLHKYPGLFTPEELNALTQMRGIPANINPELHLSIIRREWNAFYRRIDADRLRGIQPTRQQFIDKAAEIDRLYGSQFTPPVP